LKYIINMSNKYLSLSNREDRIEISLSQSDTGNRNDVRVNKLDLSQMDMDKGTLEAKYYLLREEHAAVHDKLKKQKESSRQALMQAETMGMMTKYQLVFVKMETAFAKIFSHNKLRDLKKMQESFAKFKFNTIQKRININCGARVALENYKGLDSVYKLYNRNQKFNLRDAFQSWKRSIKIEKVINIKKRQIDGEIEDKKTEAKNIEQKIKQVDDEIKEVDKKKNKFQEDKEKQEKKRDNDLNDINQMLNPSGIRNNKDQLAQLKARLANAMSENKELNTQILSTNTNVQSFISEMHSLMTSHEILAMTNNEQMFEEESGGGSVYNDDQREDYPKPTQKYTPHYNTTTQGGASYNGKGKRRTHK
jgi:hypothetical protein